MTKNYVLDTNVLLIDPDAIYKFADNNVIIPITVIEEVDNFKTQKRDDERSRELARMARRVSRNLDSLAKTGRLDQGVPIGNGGGTLRVVLTLSQTLLRLPIDLADDKEDNRILSVAIDYAAIMVSNDINMRIKAAAVGLSAEEYQATAVKSEELYTGTGRGYVTAEDLIKIYKEGKLEVGDVTVVGEDTELYPNQSFTLVSMDNPKQAALARYDAVMKEYRLIPSDLKTLGLTPKNAEQQHAINLLLDPDIKLVSLIGKAGSGKTLLALAAGLHGVTESKLYSKMLLLKPIVAMDNSHQLGYLPGSMEEKLGPWLSSYHDNIDFIMGSTTYEEPHKLTKIRTKKEHEQFSCWSEKKEASAKVSKAEMLISMGLLELGSLEHIRGRSLPNQFIIIDECQGLTNNAIKTIITRAGEGTKIVILGDIEQIDLPYLSADNNGLIYVADKFKNHKIAGHITLTRSVRSELAEIAAEIL